MDIAPALLLATLLWQVVDFIREVTGAADPAQPEAKWSAPKWQAAAWIAGILVVLLAAHAQLFDTFTVNGLTLTSMDLGSQIFLGLCIASFASTGVDIKQAIDGGDTAKKP